MHRYTAHSQQIHGTVQWVSTGCLVLILTEAMGGCEETDTSTPAGYGETSHTFMVCGLNVVSNYIQRNCISITCKDAENFGSLRDKMPASCLITEHSFFRVAQVVGKMYRKQSTMGAGRSYDLRQLHLVDQHLFKEETVHQYVTCLHTSTHRATNAETVTYSQCNGNYCQCC